MERIILKKTINFIKQLQKQNKPIYYERRNATGFNYQAGLPDIFFIVNGRHYEIELKRPDQKIKYNPLQVYWLNKFKELNTPAIISNDFEEIKKFILDAFNN